LNLNRTIFTATRGLQRHRKYVFGQGFARAPLGRGGGHSAPPAHIAGFEGRENGRKEEKGREKVMEKEGNGGGNTPNKFLVTVLIFVIISNL